MINTKRNKRLVWIAFVFPVFGLLVLYYINNALELQFLTSFIQGKKALTEDSYLQSFQTGIFSIFWSCVSIILYATLMIRFSDILLKPAK